MHLLEALTRPLEKPGKMGNAPILSEPLSTVGPLKQSKGDPTKVRQKRWGVRRSRAVERLFFRYGQPNVKRLGGSARRRGEVGKKNTKVMNFYNWSSQAIRLLLSGRRIVSHHGVCRADELTGSSAPCRVAERHRKKVTPAATSRALPRT